MDPEIAAALVGGLLALVGLRHRHGATAGSPTAGQQIAERGRGLSSRGAVVVRAVGSTATSVSVGAGEAAVFGAAFAARGVARAAGRVATDVAAGGVAVAGQLAAGAGGLVVDGVAGLRDGASVVLQPVRRGSAPPGT